MTTIHVTASRDYDVLVQPGLLDDAGAQIARVLGTGRTAAIVAGELPVHQDDQSPETIGRISYQCGLIFQQYRIDHLLPDITQDDTTDQVRHEEYGTEQVGSFDLSGQRQCQNERKHVNGNDRYNRKL